MKAYMGYDAQVGPEEGASLVFARTAKEAKKVFWATCSGDLVEEFTDARVKLIRDSPWLLREADPAKVAAGEAHALLAPKSCDNCGQWGHAAIGDLGLCPDCLEARRADEKDGLRSGRLN